MKHWKLVLSSLLMAALLVWGVSRWLNDPKRLETKALTHYLQNDFLSAGKLLSQLEQEGGSISPEIALWQSYVYREQGYWGRSSQKILLGLSLFPNLQQIPSKQEQRVALELALGLALNGYLNDSESSFIEGLRIAYAIAPKEPWVALFKMIEHAIASDWEGVELWIEQQAKRSLLSPWMAKPFERTFTKDQEKLLLAQAHIERGQTVHARELLEAMKEKPLLKEAAYLLGLSYLIDAKERSDTVAMGYYRLGLSFLEPLGLEQPHWKKQRARVSALLAKEALEQLALSERHFFAGEEFVPLSEQHQIKREHFTFFIEALSRWNADDHLRVLATHFIDSLVREENAELFPRFERVQNALIERDARWRPHVEQELLQRLEAAFRQDQWELVQQFWTMSQQPGASFSSTFNQQAAEKIEQAVYQKFLETVQLASSGQPKELLDEKIELLKHYFPLLSNSKQDEESRALFALRLAEQTKPLISGQTLSPHAGELIALLFNEGLTAEQEELRGFVRDKLRRRFAQAKSAQDIATMALIYDIAQKAQLDVVEEPSKQRIANMLADAQYLLDSGRAAQAQEQLAWLLKLAPQHEEALHLLGSSFFATEQYAQAKELLLTLDSPSIVLKQMLAISFLKTGEIERGVHLVGKIAQDQISDRLKLEMGIVKANQGAWQEARTWWKSIPVKSEQLSLLLFLSSHNLNTHQESWQLYSALSTSLRFAPEIVSLATRACIALEQYPVAQSLLTRSLETAKITELPTHLKKLLERYSLAQERDLAFTAAQFYEEIEKDHEKALTFLNQSAHRSWRVHVGKARALTALRAFEAAQKELTQTKTRFQIELSQEYEEFWRAQCLLEHAQGHFEKFLTLYEEMRLQIAPQRALELLQVQTYAQLWNYPKAYELLLSNLGNGDFKELKVQEQLLALELLAKAGRSRELLQQIDLLPQHLLSSRNQWHLAELTLQTYTQQELELITPSLHSFSQLSSSDKGRALLYLMESGHTTRASLWASEHERHLKTSVLGLCALAKSAFFSKEWLQAQGYLTQLFALERASLEPSDRSHSTLIEVAKVCQELPSLDLMQAVAPFFTQEGEREEDYFGMSLEGQIKQRSARLLLFNAKVKRDEQLSREELAETRFYQEELSAELTSRIDKPLSHWHLFLCSTLLASPTKAEQQLHALSAYALGAVNLHVEIASLLIEARQIHLAKTQLDKAQLYFPLSAQIPTLAAQIALVPFEEIEAKKISAREEMEIMALIKRALERAPYAPAAPLLLARLSLLTGNYPRAHQELQKVLFLRPDLPKARALLKVTLRKRMEEEGTRVEWQQELERLKEPGA